MALFKCFPGFLKLVSDSVSRKCARCYAFRSALTTSEADNTSPSLLKAALFRQVAQSFCEVFV